MHVSIVVQSLDDDVIVALAHSMTYQIFSIGIMALLTLSVTAQTLVPIEMATKKQKNNNKRNDVVTTIKGKCYAKTLINRLIHWGLLFGGSLGITQLLLLPF